MADGLEEFLNGVGDKTGGDDKTQPKDTTSSNDNAREQALAAREARVAERERAVTERENAVAQRENAVAQREFRLKQNSTPTPLSTQSQPLNTASTVNESVSAKPSNGFRSGLVDGAKSTGDLGKKVVGGILGTLFEFGKGVVSTIGTKIADVVGGTVKRGLGILTTIYLVGSLIPAPFQAGFAEDAAKKETPNYFIRTLHNWGSNLKLGYVFGKDAIKDEFIKVEESTPVIKDKELENETDVKNDTQDQGFLILPSENVENDYFENTPRLSANFSAVNDNDVHDNQTYILTAHDLSTLKAAHAVTPS